MDIDESARTAPIMGIVHFYWIMKNSELLL